MTPHSDDQEQADWSVSSNHHTLEDEDGAE